MRKWLRWPALWLNKHYISGSEFEIYINKGALKCVTGVCMGSFLDMKVVHSFETFGYVKLPTALCNVPEDQNHQCQCCENIKSHNSALHCQLCTSVDGLWENVCRFYVRQVGLFVTVLQMQPVRIH